jgi:uncharacterized membrane protein
MSIKIVSNSLVAVLVAGGFYILYMSSIKITKLNNFIKMEISIFLFVLLIIGLIGAITTVLYQQLRINRLIDKIEDPGSEKNINELE